VTDGASETMRIGGGAHAPRVAKSAILTVMAMAIALKRSTSRSYLIASAPVSGRTPLLHSRDSLN
jgi:hypothetical protein